MACLSSPLPIPGLTGAKPSVACVTQVLRNCAAYPQLPTFCCSDLLRLWLCCGTGTTHAAVVLGARDSSGRLQIVCRDTSFFVPEKASDDRTRPFSAVSWARTRLHVDGDLLSFNVYAIVSAHIYVISPKFAACRYGRQAALRLRSPRLFCWCRM